MIASDDNHNGNGNDDAKVSSGRVLIVEDDEHISMAIKVRLEANGFEVVTAIDAIVGLDMAVKKQPDLVILDISMPGGNGFRVAERLMTVADNPPPIIFITASTLPELRERANRLKALAFFEKPFDVDDLIPIVRDGIRNYRSA